MIVFRKHGSGSSVHVSVQHFFIFFYFKYPNTRFFIRVTECFSHSSYRTRRVQSFQGPWAIMWSSSGVLFVCFRTIENPSTKHRPRRNKHATYPHYRRRHSFTQLKQNCQNVLIRSEPICVGCGPNGCGRLGLHQGTFTVCNGGRYLNLAGVHMGGKWGKWYLRSIFQHKIKQRREIFLFFLRFWFVHCRIWQYLFIWILKRRPLVLLQLQTTQLFSNADLDICVFKRQHKRLRVFCGHWPLLPDWSRWKVCVSVSCPPEVRLGC